MAMTDTAAGQPSASVGPWDKVGLAGKAALALTSTFVALGLFTIGAALPPLQADFAKTNGAAMFIQLIGSIAAPAFALASPLAGAAVARLGVRKVYSFSIAAFALIGAAPAISQSLAVILVLRALLGVAIAGAFTAGMAGIARLPDRQRHTMLGLSAFLGGGISIFAYPLTGLLAAQSWRLAFLLSAALLPVALLVLGLPAEGRRAAQSGAIHTPMAKSRLPVSLLTTAVVTGWTMVASSIYSPFYLGAIGITDPAAIGSILAVLAFGSLIGSGSYSLAQKRFGTRRTLAVSLAFALAGCAVLALGSGAIAAMIGLSILGIGLGGGGTAIYALAIETVGPQGDSAAATGLTSLALYLPQLGFPLGAGVVGALLGPPAVYAAVAVLLGLAIGLVMSGGDAQPPLPQPRFDALHPGI